MATARGPIAAVGRFCERGYLASELEADDAPADDGSVRPQDAVEVMQMKIQAFNREQRWIFKALNAVEPGARLCGARMA